MYSKDQNNAIMQSKGKKRGGNGREKEEEEEDRKLMQLQVNCLSWSDEL